MKKRILVFGNPLVPADSIALKLAPMLQKAFPEIEFTEVDAAEDLEKKGKHLFILDSAKGMRRPAVIHGTNALESPSSLYSLHDFDLAMHLKLLKKLGLVEKVTLFCVPQRYPLKKAFSEVSKLIRATLLRPAARRG